MKFAFNECRGDYIVTIDMDLSYSPDHIERLVDTLRKTRAKIVLASPYLEGGAVENVPEVRRLLSVGANKFFIDRCTWATEDPDRHGAGVRRKILADPGLLLHGDGGQQ